MPSVRKMISFRPANDETAGRLRDLQRAWGGVEDLGIGRTIDEAIRRAHAVEIKQDKPPKRGRKGA